MTQKKKSLGKKRFVGLKKRFVRDFDQHMHTKTFQGGPEPLENEINKILGSKREDRFSDHFSDLVQNILFCSFFVPASPQHFL